MRPAVDAIDNHVAPLAQFIRQSFRHQPSDDAATRCGIKDRMITGRAFDSCGLQLAVHGLDDVAALTHPPQGRLELWREAPHACRGLFRQAHALQHAQPPHPQGMPPWIAFRLGGKRKDAVACIPQNAAVKMGEALRTHLLLEFA
jgi:hypothetical protein